MIYQDPLAYLLGLEGIALLDAWAGDYDRTFTDARLAEIRRLLDDEKLRGRGVVAERVSTVTAYEQQAAGYDAEAGGGLFATDEPLVAECLSGREPGTALDAACGTGRFAEFLAGRGHRVIGVDSSPDMLAYARRRVPGGEFHVAELERLPLADDSVDVIVCALALVHVPRLEPVLAEFARVLRPGGDLVISDIHHKLVTQGSVIKARGPAGEPWISATYRHHLGDYLRPALSLGLRVRRCEEPTATGTGAPLPAPATEIGDWRDWPWSLMNYLPPAARAASGGGPHLVIWHFQAPPPEAAAPVPDYRVRPATADDVEFLADVVIEATRAQGRLPDGFDEQRWREDFTHWTLEQVRSQSHDAATSVVEVGNERAGRLRVTRTAGGIELSGIQLLPRFQRLGIGTAIIEALKAQAAAAGIPLDLGVEKDNPGARKLYERLGFRRRGETGQEYKLRWDGSADA